MSEPFKLNDPVAFARDFAAGLHRDRGQRYDGHDYVFHLDQVFGTLAAHGATERDLLTTAYLHDVLEDTGIPLELVDKLFGLTVGGAVWCVTDEPGKNRKERKVKTYPKIATNPISLVVKLADRIANVEHSMASKIDGEVDGPISKAERSASLLDMYRKEHRAFTDALYPACQQFAQAIELMGVHIEDMWNHLNQVLEDK